MADKEPSNEEEPISPSMNQESLIDSGRANSNHTSVTKLQQLLSEADRNAMDYFAESEV